jgi:hypothetical protein
MPLFKVLHAMPPTNNLESSSLEQNCIFLTKLQIIFWGGVKTGDHTFRRGPFLLKCKKMLSALFFIFFNVLDHYILRLPLSPSPPPPFSQSSPILVSKQ